MVSKPRGKSSETPSLPPATTLDGRESQLVNLAVNLAEKQLKDGTASSQVITHYLKLGSTREQLEQLRLQNEIAMIEAKRQEIEDRQNMADLMTEAMLAFTSYKGGVVELEEGDDEDPYVS